MEEFHHLAPFLQKLWEMMSHPELVPNLRWGTAWVQSDGSVVGSGARPGSREVDTLVISDLETFAATVLPHYFKHNNWASFTRQLNWYGFTKVTGGAPEHFVFYQPHFRRDHPEELPLVRRRAKEEAGDSGADDGGAAAASGEEEAPVGRTRESSRLATRRASASASQSAHTHASPGRGGGGGGGGGGAGTVRRRAPSGSGAGGMADSMEEGAAAAAAALSVINEAVEHNTEIRVTALEERVGELERQVAVAATEASALRSHVLQQTNHAAALEALLWELHDTLRRVNIVWPQASGPTAAALTRAQFHAALSTLVPLPHVAPAVGDDPLLAALAAADLPAAAAPAAPAAAAAAHYHHHAKRPRNDPLPSPPSAGTGALLLANPSPAASAASSAHHHGGSNGDGLAPVFPHLFTSPSFPSFPAAAGVPGLDASAAPRVGGGGGSGGGAGGLTMHVPLMQRMHTLDEDRSVPAAAYLAPALPPDGTPQGAAAGLTPSAYFAGGVAAPPAK